MERPKSTAADISREIRGWAIFALGAVVSTVVAYTVTTVIIKGKSVVDMLNSNTKKENEFEPAE